MRDRASGSTDGNGLLEPYEVKVSSTVLRGEGDGDAALLPDHSVILAEILAVWKLEIGS